jgi:hypothetical protein
MTMPLLQRPVFWLALGALRGLNGPDGAHFARCGRISASSEKPRVSQRMISALGWDADVATSSYQYLSQLLRSRR